MKEPTGYIQHALESIALIEAATKGGRDEFFASSLIQDATLYRLQTMAESTQRLPDDLKERYPEIDWRAIAGFRNVLVHGYMSIRLQTVWNVVEHEIPPLKAVLRRMLIEVEGK